MYFVQILQEQVAQLVRGGIPHLLTALLVLVVGWLVALVLSSGARGALRRTKLDERLGLWIAGEKEAKSIDVVRLVGKGVYYLVMFFVLVAFFQTLGLTLITEPLNQLLIQVFNYAPRIVGAGILLLIAWVVANVLKFIVVRALRLVKIDKELANKISLENEKRVSQAKIISDVVYWLVFLLFLPAVLGALALEGVLVPVQGMVDKILVFLPNIFAAILILAIGWFGARIVQLIVTNVLAAAGTDQLGERVGLNKVLEKQTLSGLSGLVLYFLILIPVLIAALNALALEAITQPASKMLDTILGALPAIFAALLLIAISYVVGRVVTELITRLLTGMGFNVVLLRLGLVKKEPAEGERTPSEIVGYLVLVGIILFASIEALQLLGFGSVAELVARFTSFAGHVVLGFVVFGIGFFLANLAAKTIQASGSAQAGLLALAARVAILVLAGAMSLREMGLANEIIILAFGLLVGAVALAVALAFGFGAREIAANEMRRWVELIKSKSNT